MENSTESMYDTLRLGKVKESLETPTSIHYAV
jgi:hypothetical protein